MNRRQFLAGSVPATLGLAGCSTGTTDSDEDGTPPGSTPEGFWRYVSLPEQDSVSENHQVGLTAVVEDPWITSANTATVAVTLTNRAPRLRTVYEFDYPEVLRGFFRDEGAVLGPSRPPECIDTDGKESGPFGETDPPWRREFEAGESLTRTYGVLDDPRSAGCISPGTYRFIWNLAYKDAPRDEAAGRPDFTWWIDLEIQAPD